jgi:PIN domain nuclease of toxin-antitoxin system
VSEPVLLDATAALAAIFDEPGGDFLAKMNPDPEPVMTSYNAAEALSKMIQRGFTPEDALAALQGIVQGMLPVGASSAFDAAKIHAASRHLGLSLGDCFCLAAGLTTRLPIYTADREWAKLGIKGIKLRFIR